MGVAPAPHGLITLRHQATVSQVAAPPRSLRAYALWLHFLALFGLLLLDRRTQGQAKA
jgi:hypothetical protein